MLYKMVLAFESVDEILKCDQSNKNKFGEMLTFELKVPGFGSEMIYR